MLISHQPITKYEKHMNTAKIDVRHIFYRFKGSYRTNNSDR